jgi:hypothetical protein
MLPYDRRLDPKGSVMTADLHLKCLECGRRFSCRPTPRGRYPRTCSPTCRASRKRAHDRRYRAEGRYTAGNRKSYSGICSVCAAPFVSQNRPTKTCSRQCGAIWNGRVRTERARARNARHCELCGAAFQPSNPSARQRRAGHRQKFCSTECANLARRNLSGKNV